MSIRALIRCGAALFFVGLVAGCSVIGSDTAVRSDECKSNRRACLYEGSYEPGERDYAEHEAARLNQAAIAKLRRNSIR